MVCMEWHRPANTGRILGKQLRCPSQHFYVVHDLMAAKLHHTHLKGLNWKDIWYLPHGEWRILVSTQAQVSKQEKCMKGISRNHIIAELIAMSAGVRTATVGCTFWTKERKLDILWVLENHGNIICCRKVGET